MHTHKHTHTHTHTNTHIHIHTQTHTCTHTNTTHAHTHTYTQGYTDAHTHKRLVQVSLHFQSGVQQLCYCLVCVKLHQAVRQALFVDVSQVLVLCQGQGLV